MWLYYNFFQPVMRLEEKIALGSLDNSNNPRVRRKFDDAQTPYDRLCATNTLTPERKQQLDTLRQQTNPRQLRHTIYKNIDQLFSLPYSASDQSQNVHLTLNLNPPISLNPTTAVDIGTAHALTT